MDGDISNVMQKSIEMLKKYVTGASKEGSIRAPTRRKLRRYIARAVVEDFKDQR